MANVKPILIVTNLYPVPWAPNRASFNKKQFDLLSQKKTIKIIILVGWLEWLKHKSHVKNTADVRYCPYFYIPKFARPLVPFFQFISLLFLLPWIKNINPQAIFASWGFPDGVAVSMLSKILNKPLYIKVHGTDVNENIGHGLRKKLITYWFNKARRVFCVSQNLADILIRSGVDKDRLVVNYNGVDQNVFFPQAKTPSSKLVFVGSIIATKGVNELLDAFNDVYQQNKSLELDIIGCGPLMANLQQKITDLGLTKQVNLLGSINIEQVASCIRKADLLVLPSYREGVPNVVLEAFASGIPVVATDVGGISEILTQDTGMLIAAQNVDELSNAIQQSLNRHWDVSHILAHANQFSWAKNIDNLLSNMEAQ